MAVAAGRGCAPSIGPIALIGDVVSLAKLAAASLDDAATPRSLTVVARKHEDAGPTRWGREA